MHRPTAVAAVAPQVRENRLSCDGASKRVPLRLVGATTAAGQCWVRSADWMLVELAVRRCPAATVEPWPGGAADEGIIKATAGLPVEALRPELSAAHRGGACYSPRVNHAAAGSEEEFWADMPDAETPPGGALTTEANALLLLPGGELPLACLVAVGSRRRGFLDDVFSWIHRSIGQEDGTGVRRPIKRERGSSAGRRSAN
nr:unnamed protein product [Digitaria exilis]